MVMAMTHDQPDNVNRLRRLGVGEGISPEKYRGAAVAKAISRLMGSAEVAANCGAVARRFGDGDAFSRTCQLIEEMVAAGVAV